MQLPAVAAALTSLCPPLPTPSPPKGVLVGDWWKDRLDCRQWGAHFPHVAGIAGQSNVGAQVGPADTGRERARGHAPHPAPYKAGERLRAPAAPVLCSCLAPADLPPFASPAPLNPTPRAWIGP